MSANNSTSIIYTGPLGYSLAARIVITSVLMVILIMTVCGNLVVMLAVARLRSMRTLSNAFVFSLAVADTLVAVGVMPGAVLLQWNNGEWTLGRPFCLVWLSWDIYFSTISIVHFSCLAIDRFLAICDPFRYPRLVTKLSVAVMLITCWLLPGFISYLPIYTGWHTYGIEHLLLREPIEHTCFPLVNLPFALICSVLAFYAPLAAILFCYWRIFVVARRHAKKIRGLEIAAPERSRISKMQRDTKAAKTLAIVVGAFSLCYLPFFTLNVLDPFFDYSLDETKGNKVWLAITWLGYCNSMLNPWIYYVSNKNFRAAFRKILGCKNNHSGSRSDDDGDCTEVTALNRTRTNGHLQIFPSQAVGVGTVV
uniref:G-protein coupled receptors family 1 profile domain-containing protein n=1 Tax=Strigamia maritima TaxID=126957 RepID=T1IW05_STRMM